jgi:pSer/pThr/pTyr-binding forkhead associated (FHA) protein
MPASKVILKVAEGRLNEQEYIFTDRTHCILGRAEDCDIQVPLDQDHADVSRHHCLFELDPPAVRVRDLGSRNGTFVNGEKIGQNPDRPATAESGVWHSTATRTLRSGDVVRVGSTEIGVTIEQTSDAREVFRSPLDCLEYP